MNADLGNPRIGFQQPLLLPQMAPASAQFSRIWEVLSDFEKRIVREEAHFDFDWRQPQAPQICSGTFAQISEISDGLHEVINTVLLSEEKVKNLETKAEQLKNCAVHIFGKIAELQKKFKPRTRRFGSKSAMECHRVCAGCTDDLGTNPGGDYLSKG